MSAQQICYFVPGNLTAHAAGAAEASRRTAYLQERVLGDAQISLHDNLNGPASIESAAEERAAAAGMMALLPEIGASHDAIIIGCFGDPGMRDAQAAVSVPVVGPAGASLHLAAQLGSQIGILTVVSEVIPVLEHLVEGYGLASRISGIAAVEIPVLELRERREEVFDRLIAEGEKARLQGAEALVLGCMTMGFLDVAGDLQAELDIPVINPALAALHTAETVLGLSRAKTMATAG